MNEAGGHHQPRITRIARWMNYTVPPTLLPSGYQDSESYQFHSAQGPSLTRYWVVLQLNQGSNSWMIDSQRMTEKTRIKHEMIAIESRIVMLKTGAQVRADLWMEQMKECESVPINKLMLQESEGVRKKVKVNEESLARTECPYISTIRRHLLDFDFEKVCSISLSNKRVYVCLVCGKYFQGKSQNTYAYVHSLEQSHHMFMNLQDTRIYCLPDNYEVFDKSLSDIQFNLNPKFTPERIAELDQNTQVSRALDGTTFLPGFVGLNNLNKTDYFNVIMQAFCRIKPLRDYMVIFDTRSENTDPFEMKYLISQRFSELVRKIWNPRNYKGHVSPHELLQAITLKSNKQFQIGMSSDPVRLMVWLLDTIKKEQMSINKLNTIIQSCFEGEIEIEYFKPLRNGVGYNLQADLERKPFYYLSLELPQVVLYKNDEDKKKMPSLPLQQLLRKYDGMMNTDSSDGRRRYRITRFPKYLLIHIKRFVKNNFFLEKLTTIVTFHLDLDLGELGMEAKYSLVANICHEGNAKVGFYKVHVRNQANNRWYLMQDLHLQEVVPELIEVSEAYILVYELQE